MIDQQFKTGLPFDGEIYIDSTSESFKKASLPRLSLWQISKRFLLNVKLFSLFYSLNKKHGASDASGDGQQTGGVFIFGPGSKSEIIFSFRENDNEPDVFVDVDEIWAACGGSGSWKSEDQAPASSSSSSSSAPADASDDDVASSPPPAAAADPGPAEGDAASSSSSSASVSPSSSPEAPSVEVREPDLSSAPVPKSETVA